MVEHNKSPLLDLLLTDKSFTSIFQIDQTPTLAYGNQALLRASFNVWKTCRNKNGLNYKRRNLSCMRSEVDGLQNKPSMGSQQKGESVKLLLEKATRRFCTSDGNQNEEVQQNSI